MSKEKMTPDVRFEGYNNNWKKSDFADVFEHPVSTNSLSRSQLNHVDGEIMNVHYGDILVKYNSVLDIGKDDIPFITNATLTEYKSNLLENGDIVFADAAEDEMVGKVVEIIRENDEHIVAGLHTIVARPRNKLSDFFCGYYINSDKYHNQLSKLMQGTKVLSISKKTLQKTAVSYPDSHEEQRQIGLFFKRIDDTINLHKRELIKLQNFKQAMLQKMFPKEGEKVPEIRFEGFEDEWTELPLSGVTDSYNNLRIPVTASDRKKGTTPYYGANGIQDYVEGFTHKGEFVLLAEDGANDLSNYPVRYVEGEIWVNNHAHVLSGRESICKNKFLSYSFKTVDIAQYLVGGSRYKLNANTLRNINLLFPGLSEQELIGSYFYRLDKQKQAKQAELAKLKQFKQAMLDKLFV